MLTRLALANTIRSKALELGFYACGFAKAQPLDQETKKLKAWLKAGRHGEMGYMENHLAKRTDPTKLVPGAQTVIVLLHNYAPTHSKLSANGMKISRYAYGTDYHFVMKRKLRDLMGFIQQLQPETQGRVFVDSAPVLERSWAEKAGLGWIGKNTCLITKEKGSYFFIGEIITNLELPEEHALVPNHCGGCTRCIQACPTDALDADGLDAAKCISYITIEYRRENIPESFTGKMDHWIFGCDICQEVCPWNRFAEPHSEPEFLPSEELSTMKKQDWANLDTERFKRLFRNSPVKRTKFSGLKRNIKFAGPYEGPGPS